MEKEEKNMIKILSFISKINKNKKVIHTKIKKKILIIIHCLIRKLNLKNDVLLNIIISRLIIVYIHSN